MDRTAKQIVDKLYGEDETRTRFRVWWIPQVPGEPFYSEELMSFAEARAIEHTLSRYDMFLLENRIRLDFSNTGGIEYWDETEGAWVSIDESEYDEWEGK